MWKIINEIAGKSNRNKINKDKIKHSIDEIVYDDISIVN